ncbi:MAG: hypothetical protein TECD_00797 [Hyphomicrobiaceae bacterium hypho_1]
MQYNIWRKLILATSLCVFVVVTATTIISTSSIKFFKIFFLQELQHQIISFIRLKHHMYWKNGLKLPGAPDFEALENRLTVHGLSLGSPVFIRIFKSEFQLELWIKRENIFHLFAVYPICRWSGQLGPKLKVGDHQSPEGFYTVEASAMNPNSRWHRSFDLGFPNAYDRQHSRTGKYLMVHGGCSSVGCYAVTDDAISEIWKLTKAAHQFGQSRFHVHIYPFRMTAMNLSLYHNPRWKNFWLNLKEGYDAFERTWLPPKVSICNYSYAFKVVTDIQSNGGHKIDSNCPPQVN